MTVLAPPARDDMRNGPGAPTRPEAVQPTHQLTNSLTHGTLPPQRLQLVQQQLARRERRLGDHVVHPPPVPAVHHEAALAQNPQVVRHQRLPHLEPLGQVTHRCLAPHQLLENPETRLVAQSAKAEGRAGAPAVVGGGHWFNILINIFLSYCPRVPSRPSERVPGFPPPPP